MNQSDFEFPASFNLCEYFLDHNLTAGRGAKTALICGTNSRTYAEVAEGAKRLAATLRRHGHRPEERVLIVLPDCFEFAETFFGILRAGGVFAMVNPLLKREDFEYYLAYSKARIVITHESVLPEIGAAATESASTETVLVVGNDAGGFTSYAEALSAENPDSDLAQMALTGPDDLAGWLFTSGSTGHP
ncbi:MAG: acyl-coenzyme A synthetase/AMP-(fatty) acid ligase, partial [Planctomycetota bacterium]